jgi:predicted ABC-type ATPase
VPLDVDRLRSALKADKRLESSHTFLNSFQAAASLLTVPPETCDAYVAAALADYLREELLTLGLSFSFETVMSHPSKVEFFARARAAGYRTYLYFVATETPLLNVHRVENRSHLGGHDVPHDKIVDRYQRCLQLAPEALSHAARAFLFDNSGVEPVWLAQLLPEGTLELRVTRSRLPSWFIKSIASHFNL